MGVGRALLASPLPLTDPDARPDLQHSMPRLQHIRGVRVLEASQPAGGVSYVFGGCRTDDASGRRAGFQERNQRAQRNLPFLVQR